MNEDAFLSALHDAPNDEVTWLALADWLEEHDQPLRAELIRLVRHSRTLPLMRRTQERARTEDRIVELLLAGVRPAVPEVVNSIGMRLALVPPGFCRMGSLRQEKDRWENEIAHETEITRPYYLGVFPVTQAEYLAVTGTNPSTFRKGGDDGARVAGMDTGRFPVEMVSWQHAARFCDLLSARPEEKRAGRKYRLPTEGEWEYACRGGSASTLAFVTGHSISPQYANYDDVLNRTCVVGSYLPNTFGLYDLQGNVWEWCHDGFERGFYREERMIDPVGSAETQRVCRGSAFDDDERKCRTAARLHGSLDGVYRFVGFRAALTWRKAAGN